MIRARSNVVEISSMEFSDCAKRLTSLYMMNLVLEKARSQLGVANDKETAACTFT